MSTAPTLAAMNTALTGDLTFTTAPAHPLDVGAEEGFDVAGLLDPGTLLALGGVFLLVVAVISVMVWLAWRRLRRSALLARGRQLTAQGTSAWSAYRLPPGPRRDLAQLDLEVTRRRGELRRQVAAARAAGTHLGDVPALLPGIEVEGDRIQSGLRQCVLSPSPGAEERRADLKLEVQAFLSIVESVSDAVLAATLAPPVADRLATDVDEAVSGLRAYTAAYRELTAPPPPVSFPPPPQAQPDTREVTP